MIVNRQQFIDYGICTDGLILLDQLLNGATEIDYNELCMRLIALESKMGKEWVIKQLFDPQEHIADLELAREYMGIKNCNNVLRSVNIENSQNIYKCRNIKNSSNCYDSENLENCHYCHSCKNSKNMIFCDDTLNFSKGYAVCNISVSEQRFNEVLNTIKPQQQEAQQSPMIRLMATAAPAASFNAKDFAASLPEFNKSRTVKLGDFK